MVYATNGTCTRNGWAAFSVFETKKGLFGLFVNWLILASERKGM